MGLNFRELRRLGLAALVAVATAQAADAVGAEDPAPEGARNSPHTGRVGLLPRWPRAGRDGLGWYGGSGPYSSLYSPGYGWYGGSGSGLYRGWFGPGSGWYGGGGPYQGWYGPGLGWYGPSPWW
jgi:hypothetical protein